MSFAKSVGLLVLLAVFGTTANWAAPTTNVDPNKIWIVKGTVVQASGEPLQGAEAIAHAGVGTLRVTGRTMSKADGSFELWFGPGWWSKNQEGVQAAQISIHKKGWFETNLSRQGELLAAHKIPQGEIGWGGKTAQDIFLPNEAKTLKFTMKPAANLSGQLVDEKGVTISNKRVGIATDELPRRVLAEVRTNEKGQFKFTDLPTTSLKIYAETEKNWREWPTVTIQFNEPREFKGQLERDGDQINFSIAP